MSDFIFNGKSASSLGLGIERYPAIPMPRKKITALSIPGRSGDLHVDEGGLENVIVRYEVWWKNPSKAYSTGRSAREITRWLYGAPVGARLEDTYDSAIYRTATFLGGVDIEDIMGRFGRVVLEFSCSPQKWLKSAESALVFQAPGGLLNNLTQNPTKPLIRIIGSVGGRLSIGDSGMTLRFPGMDTHEFWIDCEEMEAWEVVAGQEVSSNAWIDDLDFLQILPGVNEVRFPSSFDSVTIWTRTYYL